MNKKGKYKNVLDHGFEIWLDIVLNDQQKDVISQIDDSALEATQITNLKVELLNNKENIKLESLAYFKNLRWLGII